MLLAQTFTDGLKDGLQEVGNALVSWIPKIVGALLILIIGWFIARLIRNVLRRIFEAIGFDKLLDKAGVGEAIRNAGYTASGVLTAIVYYLLMALVLLLAAEALGIDELTALLSGLISYLPRLIVAVIILVVAAALGTFVADVVRPLADSQNMGWAATVARWLVIFVGIIASFEVLDLAPVLVTSVVMSFFGALGVALGVSVAIAFGVGGIDTARKWWSKLDPKD